MRPLAKVIGLASIAVVVVLGASWVIPFPGHGPVRSYSVAAEPLADMTLTSAFAVQNLSSTEDAAVIAIFYNVDGSEATRVPMTIARGSLGNFAMPSSLPAGWKGSVVVESNVPVTAITNVMTPDGSSPYAFGSNDGMMPGSSGYMGETGTTMYLPFILRERNGRSTTFGVQNAGSTATSVTITYYNLDGSVRYSFVKTLQPGQSEIRRQKVDDTFLPLGFMGSVIATSSGEQLAAGVNDVGYGVIYSYNGIPSPSTTLYLPFMVRNRSNQNTAFLIQNTTAGGATVNVNYVGSSPSGAVNVNHTASLGPYQGWNLAQSSVPGLPDGFLGSAKVISSQPVVGIVNHSYGGFSEVGNKACYNALTKGSRTITLPYIVRNRSSKSQGVIVQNVGGADTSVTFSFTPLAGGGNGSPFSKTMSIGPGGFWNFGTYWPDFAGMQDGAYGVATLTSTNSDIVAIVNTSRTDSVWGDTLGSYNGINR